MKGIVLLTLATALFLGVCAKKLHMEPVFKITTTVGTIEVKLYAETSKHRANFLKLVEMEFYDSVLFHRVIADFMIQTGDPDSPP